MTEEEYVLSAHSAAEEAYYYAGTHRLPHSTAYSSTTQVAEDVNASLICQQDIDDNSAPDLAQIGLDSPIDFQGLDSSGQAADFWTSDLGFSCYDQSQPTTKSKQECVHSAQTPSFVPSVRQWQATRPVQHPSTGFDVSPILPRQTAQRVHLTPLNTNVSSVWPTPPYSAPSRADHPAQAYPTAVSPLISLNDELAQPQWSQSAVTGVQWHFDMPPAMAINTWAQQQNSFPQTLAPADMNTTMLTPTTPTNCGSMLERTTSRTASSGMYSCEHDGCCKEFKTRTEYTHHKRNHGERHHRCDQCDKRFVFRKDLNRHIKTHSPDDRQFFCEVPGCVWATKGFQRKDHYDRRLTSRVKNSGMLTPGGSSAPMSRSPSRR